MFDRTSKRAAGLLSSATLGIAAAFGAAHAEEDGRELIIEAKNMLDQCVEVSDSCAALSGNAEAIIVFPEVFKADLIVGGAGGNGVMLQDGEPVGFYDIGRASAGLQAGIDEFAMVYVIRTEETLRDIVENGEVEAGIELGATIGTANADAVSETDDPVVYVLDADGLNLEFDVNALRIWPDPENAD